MTNEIAKLISYLSHSNISDSKFEELKEILKEYNNTQTKNCEGCRHGTFGVDSFGVEIECKLLWRCSRGHVDRYERINND